MRQRTAYVVRKSLDAEWALQCDATISGHLFCSFLALLRKELDERLTAACVSTEWDDIVRDLDRVEQITVT